MRPSEDLIHEHNAVLLALQVLERVEDAIVREAPGAMEDLEQLLDFFRGFVDACHHAKEEEVLFPELERRGVGREGGPIGVMLAEHAQGRVLVAEMSEALTRLQGGDRNAVPAIVELAQQYAALLEAHIQKENNVLFPMADQLVPDEVATALTERFETIESDRVGPGKHEAYHRMLHRLQDAYKMT